MVNSKETKPIHEQIEIYRLAYGRSTPFLINSNPNRTRFLVNSY